MSGLERQPLSSVIFPPSANETSPWNEVGELYRRICVLRVRGLSVEAARLESTELADAISRIRDSEPDDAECDARMCALFAREADRVADASVLAEILLPLLRDFAPPEVARASFARFSRPVVSDPVVSRRPPAPVPAPGIADFIDEMIQQERPSPGHGRP